MLNFAFKLFYLNVKFFSKGKKKMSNTKEIRIEDGLSHVVISIVFDCNVVYFTV